MLEDPQTLLHIHTFNESLCSRHKHDKSGTRESHHRRPPFLEHLVACHRGCVAVRAHMASSVPEERDRLQVLVLGAGVNGLTSALMLALDGFEPHIVSRDGYDETVSIGAGAIWEYPPFHVLPEELACRLALSSRVFLNELARAESATGVRLLRSGYAWRHPPSDASNPPWSRLELIDDFTPEVLPAYSRDLVGGHWHRVPILYMRRYLEWLQSACIDAGVRLHLGHTLRSRQDIGSVAAALDLGVGGGPKEARSLSQLLVINCLGLGSCTVFGDKRMFPVKGQLAYLRAPHVTDVMDDSDSPFGLTYVVPQANGVVAVAGLAQVGNDDPTPTDEVHEELLTKCRYSFPCLRDAPVVGRWAGLRPGRRDGIRLEIEYAADTDTGFDTLHNYGHCGSGVILAWGSAHRVSLLAREWAVRRGVLSKLLSSSAPPPPRELANLVALRARSEAILSDPGPPGTTVADLHTLDLHTLVATLHTLDGRAYLERFGVQAKLSMAVAAVLKERPANPLLAIAELLSKSK